MAQETTTSEVDTAKESDTSTFSLCDKGEELPVSANGWSKTDTASSTIARFVCGYRNVNTDEKLLVWTTPPKVYGKLPTGIILTEGDYGYDRAWEQDAFSEEGEGVSFEGYPGQTPADDKSYLIEWHRPGDDEDMKTHLCTDLSEVTARLRAVVTGQSKPEELISNGEMFKEESNAGESMEKATDPVKFTLHGIDHDDLPNGMFEVGKRGYPRDGFDHEAHEAATVVMEALEEEFEWAENISGVSMG